MKVCELTGADLAYWVAKCEGLEEKHSIKLYASGPCLYKETPEGGGEPFEFRPDSRWQHGGPILEKMEMSISPPSAKVHRNGGPNSGWGESGLWVASTKTRGPTGNIGLGSHETSALIAAMRAHVRWHYGDELPEL